MTIQDVAKVRTKLNTQKSNITHFYGCYVTSGNEIISRFDAAVSQMNEDDFAQYLKIFKRVFAGKPEKTLCPLGLKTADVAAKEKQLGNLYQLSKGNLEQIDALYETIIKNIHYDTNYLILLAHEAMDLKIKKDDVSYSYIAAVVCKVAQAPAVLRYTEDKIFMNGSAGSVAAGAEFGFIYPSMNDHQPDLYEALVYEKQGYLSDYDKLLQDIFNANAPKDIVTKNEEFAEILDDAVETVSMDTVRKMQDYVSERKYDELTLYGNKNLRIDGEKFESMLLTCGASQENAAEGKKSFEEKFGDDGLLADTFINTKSINIETGDASIKIRNIEENKDLVSTRLIGGVPYILIKAENGAVINGINAKFD